MNPDPSGASGFICAQGARFLLHSSILIAAALLLARLFGRSGLARSAIYRAALLAVVLAPVVSFSIERSGLSCAVRLPTASLAAAVMPPPSEDAPMYASSETAHTGAADAGAAQVLPPVKTSRPMPKPATIIAALWAAGACLLAVWLLISHVALWRTRSRSVPVEDASTLARLRRLCERLRVRAPGLRISPEVSGPILTGAVRPVVIVPQSQEEDLRNGALDRVLMHELAHQARRDCLWNLLARVVCAAGFFQPLLWTLAWRLEDAGEDAADDRVLALGADAKEYARDLAAAAERLLLRRRESIAGLGVIRFRSSLGRRVTHVLDTSRHWVASLSWTAIAVVCTLTVLATVLTAALSFAGPATEAAAPAAEPAPGTSLTLPDATDADLRALKGNQVLRELNLSRSQVTDAGLTNLAEMKDLQTLDLIGTRVTDAGLANLKELKDLVILNLSFTQVTDVGLSQLKDLKHLKSLILQGTQVTGSGLAQLKEMQSLVYLDLWKAEVNDAGLAGLKGMIGLQTLGLMYTQVTDAGLAQLKEVKGLQDLYLAGTPVTNAGLEQLKAALPNIQIYR
jgi:beta-lactamase regulating signal transducer with metallopeptidase domain